MSSLFDDRIVRRGPGAFFLVRQKGEMHSTSEPAFGGSDVIANAIAESQVALQDGFPDSP